MQKGENSFPEKGMELSTVLELLRIVRKEAEILKSHTPEVLLELLPRKQTLIYKLAKQIRALGERNSSVDESLRRYLREIYSTNERNRELLEQLLDYWGGLARVFASTIYGKEGIKAEEGSIFKGSRVDQEV